MNFHGMKRKQLQSLCKKHGIPANLKNVEMADRLSSIFKEIEKPEGGEQSSVSDSVEIDPETDLKDLPHRVKKVRFSPENETFIFISSDTEDTVLKKRPDRRKYNKNPNSSNLGAENSEEFEDSVENARAHLANMRETRAGRAAETIDHRSKPTASSESNSCRDQFRGQLRSTGQVVVKEKQKGGDCIMNATGRLTRLSKPAVAESILRCTGRVTRSRAQSLEEASRTNESIMDVGVQVESETRHVLQHGEPPRGLARKTRNSIALYKGVETVVVSDAVRDGKSTLRSSYNREKLATVLTEQKLNGRAEKKNIKKSSTNVAPEEGNAECTLGISSTSSKLLLRRFRRKGVMSQLVASNEFSVDKIAYSLKLQKPIARETICDNENEPSVRAPLRGSKRNYQKNSVILSKNTMLKASNMQQQRGSRMVSADIVALPESQISMSNIEAMNLNLNAGVSETDLSKEFPDCIQGKGSHIKARGSKEDSSTNPNALNAEEEHVALESDKSLVIKHRHSNTVSTEENEEEELFLDTSEDNLNEADDLHKDTSATVNVVVSDELASTKNKPCEGSYAPFNLEGNSRTEPSIEEQETYGEVVELDDHLVESSNDPIQESRQNFLSEGSVLEEQIGYNRESCRNSTEFFEEYEEGDHLDCNSADEASIVNQALELQDVDSGLIIALSESQKGANVTQCPSISCSVFGGQIHLEEDESACHETELPWEIPYRGKIDLNDATEIKGAGDRLRKVLEASLATVNAADRGVNGDDQIAESGAELVFSAEANVSPKSGSSVALNEPMNLNLEFDIMEVASCECESVIDSPEVTDSTQGKQFRNEIGAGKELSSVDLNTQNSKEDETEPMDSNTVLSEANGRGETLQGVTEVNSNEIYHVHEDKLVEHGQEVNEIVSYPFAAPTDSPGRCLEAELIVKQQLYERNTESVGLSAAGSFDSIHGSGQNSLLELDLKDQIEELMENKRLKINSGDYKVTMEGKTVPVKLPTVGALVMAELLLSKGAHANGEIADKENHEASEKDEEAPMEIIEKLAATRCSKNEDLTVIIRTSKDGTVIEKSSGAIAPVQDEVCKDGILVAETEDGKINQVQNEEEMVKEEKKKEDNPSFSKESSDSVENCPKNVQQADGMPNRSSGTAPELQIEEDKGAVILIPLGDNRVDDGKSASSGLACKYKITSSCCLSFEAYQDKDSFHDNEDVNRNKTQNEEEMVTGEDRMLKGLNFKGGLKNVVDVGLNEESLSGERKIDKDDNGSADAALQSLSNIGNVLFSSRKHACSLNEDAYEGEKDEADREHSPDYIKTNNADAQVAWSGEERRNLANVDFNPSIFPSDTSSKLCSPDHLGRICSGCENFEEFHSTETVGEAPPSQNILARFNVMDYEILEELNAKTSTAEFNSGEDISSSKISLEIGATMEEQTVQSTENPEMDQGIGLEEDETGNMALTLLSNKNRETASTGSMSSSGIEIVNAGENCESTEVAAVLTEVCDDIYSRMNINSFEVCGAENAHLEQSTTMSFSELVVSETSDEHEYPLNSLGSDCQWNEQNAYAENSSVTHTMLNIDTDTKLNSDRKREMQILGVKMAITVTEEDGDLKKGLPTCGQVAAGKQFMGGEEDAQDQFGENESTSSKGSAVKEQVSLLTKSSSGPRTVKTAEETSRTADSSLKRERETNVSAISEVRTSTDCDDGSSESDLQLFTTWEVSLFLGEGKTDAVEELFMEDGADSVENVMDIGDKSHAKNPAAIIPNSEYKYLENEWVETEQFLSHKKEGVLRANFDVPVAATYQITCQATDGTKEEREDHPSATIKGHINRDGTRSALTKMENASFSGNEESSEGSDQNISMKEPIAVSLGKGAEEVERQNGELKINEIAPSESSLKRMSMKTPRKLPSAFDTMKENIFTNARREQFDGSTAAGKTLMKGRKALQELQMNHQIPDCIQ